MALYNTPYNYLHATVESILNQSLKDFELIIIDDASTIKYKKFFENFNDKRIKYFKLEKNAGPGHARNEGIKKAAGEYVAIVDSDDIYMPKRFELQADFLDKNSDISLLGCTFRFSNKKKLSLMPESNEEIRTFMLFNSPLNNSTIMFRKEVFAQKNLFYSEDINFAEDYELWIKALFSGLKARNLKDFLMIYTRRPGQLSKARKEKQIAILKKIYKKIFSNVGFEASEEDLQLHHNIYLQKFKTVKFPEEISSWFDKIIEHNKKKNFFDEQTLISQKEQALIQYKKIKNRLFKIKIGEYNWCLSKSLKFYIEERD